MFRWNENIKKCFNWGINKNYLLIYQYESKRKFENKKALLINNAGQKSIYIGLLVVTLLILFIGKADFKIVNRISIIISDLLSPAISSISNQTKIIGNSFNYLKNTTSIRDENKHLLTENIRLKKFEILSKIYENENILLKSIKFNTTKLQ